MFTPYSMSVKLGDGFEAGLCMISNTSGAVCLMRSGQEIDTYRISSDKWTEIENQPTQRQVIQAIKDSDGI